MVLPENEEYFYHPDHLGSTSYITDRQGEVMQFACYLPYGEALADEHTVTDTQPYKFSGKELDGETGLYYFGARYYNPKLGTWHGVDELAEKFFWIGSYVYCSSNPINRIDPDGRWDIEVHAYKDRSKSGNAVFIVRDRNGNEVFRTVVKTLGTGGRIRDAKNSDTPQGKYNILGYRKTGEGTKYNRVSFGPNDLLALDYKGEEGGSRNGMHVHGGRQEGKYKGRANLASTHGCMRINDKDILDLKNITNGLEKNDPMEKKGILTLTDDLKSPVSYSGNRHNAGIDQFSQSSSDLDSFSPSFIPRRNMSPVDNTYVAPRVFVPYKMLKNE